MDHAETIIFEPFIKDLVSNPQGTVSSDLKLTGPIDKPQLNGDINFGNTGFTVNYLKTAYILNDKVSVANSVITINNLIIKDTHGGQGTINGKVDLNNLNKSGY